MNYANQSNTIVAYFQSTVESFLWKFFLFRNSISTDLKQREWSLCADDFKTIAGKLGKSNFHKTITFLELGSGVSTIIIPKILDRLGLAYTFYSFEADSNWHQNTEKLIKKYKLENKVKLFHVPHQQYADGPWFNKELIKRILMNQSLDVLLCDAPPGRLSPEVRNSCFPFFLPFMDEDGIVFLHDTNRNDEKEIFRKWSKYFKNCSLQNTKKGLGLFENKYPGEYADNI